jgi:hypothetical protein
MKGSIAFPPSVAASEPAICAWAALFDVEAEAPLPPLPVMVAALLRRPQLDVFIAAVASAVAQNQPMDLAQSANSASTMSPFQRERLVRRHDTEGFDGIVNPPTAPQDQYYCTSSPVLQRLAATGDVARALNIMYACGLDPAYCVVSRPSCSSITNMLTQLPDTSSTLIANGDVEGIAACIAAGLRPFKGGQQIFYGGENTEPFLMARLLPPSMAEVVTKLFGPGHKMDCDCERFMAKAQTQCIPQARAARAALQAQLPPLGDAASLVAQLPLRPEPRHWQQLLAAVSKLPGPRTQVLNALCAIHRADVAVAAFASQRHLDTAAPADYLATLRELVVALERLELRHRLANHGHTSAYNGIHSKALISGEALLLPMWRDDGAAAWTVLDASPLRSRLFLAATLGPAVGTPAVVPRAEFERRWQVLTGGLFQGFDWRHVVVAGGAVAACLDPSTDVTAPGHPQRPTDVDLFIHGLTVKGTAQVCSEIEAFVHTSAAGKAGYVTLLTKRTMTIVFADTALPRLQVVLGQWRSAADVLSTADVDCCCVGYDGHSVLATARGVLAWTHRVNFALDSHAAAEGCTYEMRLWKYWRRHAFAVAAVAPTVEALEALRAEVRAAAGTKKKGSTAWALASSAEGLQWVACVEAGLISPVQPPDALDLGGRTLDELCAHIETVGYQESDNYGSHEAGFVIVRGDSTDPTFDADRDTYALDAWSGDVYANHPGGTLMMAYDPIARADLQSALVIQDTDVAKDVYCVSWSLEYSTHAAAEDR